MAIRWKSLMDHIQDSHEECYHDPLEDLERRKQCLYQASGTCSYMYS